MVHWSEALFQESAGLYVKDLEIRTPDAAREAPLLTQLLTEHGVAPGSRILDVPCGNGRWSLELASRGYAVEGLDFSESFIEEARRRAEARGLSSSCVFKHGDMRNTAKSYPRAVFDASLVLFSSIGYYGEETDRDVLSQIRDVTRRGGVLVLETGSRDAFVRNFQPRGVLDFGDVTRLEHRVFSHETSVLEVTWSYYRKRGEDLEHLKTITYGIRLYSLHELLRLLKDSGWVTQAAYSGFDKAPYSWNTNRIVLVAENQGS